MTRPLPTPRFRPAGALAASGALVLLLAACGGAASSSAGAPPAQSSAAPQRGYGGFAGATRTPGVSGLIAAWADNTMQVQGTTSQTAVSVTSSTRITEDVATTAKAVKVGTCVTVRQATPATASAPPASTSAGTPTTPTGPLTAADVVIRPAVNGGCFGAGGASGTFTPRARPSGAPSGFTPGAQFRAFGATGQVTAVTADGFVVKEARAGTTSSVTVVTTPTTRFTTTQSAGRSAIRTGECAVATGKADSTGAVSAVAVVLSQPVNGSCQLSAFGGGFQRNG